jgi:hypothetical protein
MNPNFQVDPTAGGKVDFYQGSKMEPGQSSSFSDVYASLRSDPSLSTIDNDKLAEIAMQQSGMSPTGSSKSKTTAADKNKQYMDMYNVISPGQVGPPQGT